MWYANFFESFKFFINLFFNLLSTYYYVVHIVQSRLKVSLKILICKFYSYVAFWKGLEHDLISWTHVMQ
jgi:hypothetical protein